MVSARHIFLSVFGADGNTDTGNPAYRPGAFARIMSVDRMGGFVCPNDKQPADYPGIRRI